MRTLYTFCRTVDDLVDEPPPGLSGEQVRQQLEEWQRWLTRTPVPPNGSPMTTSLAAVVNRHAIPRRHLIELIEGCKSDLRPRPFEEFAELERYCYQTGSTVGLALCPILEVTDPRGLECARQLGIAMQLTNILRDVPEDRAMGRCYLPASELRASRGLNDVIRLQAGRARVCYRAGLAGIQWVDPAARFAIRLSAALYEAILDKIEGQGFNVFARRASTSMREKVWLAAKLRLGG